MRNKTFTNIFNFARNENVKMRTFPFNNSSQHTVISISLSSLSWLTWERSIFKLYININTFRHCYKIFLSALNHSNEYIPRVRFTCHNYPLPAIEVPLYSKYKRLIAFQKNIRYFTPYQDFNSLTAGWSLVIYIYPNEYIDYQAHRNTAIGARYTLSEQWMYMIK